MHGSGGTARCGGAAIRSGSADMDMITTLPLNGESMYALRRGRFRI